MTPIQPIRTTGSRPMNPTHPLRTEGSRRVIVCLATLALALAACSAASPSGSPSSSPTQTIHIREHPTNGIGIPVGSITGCTDEACLGDSIIGYDPVVDAATGKPVGTLTYECFLVDPGSHRYHCPGITVDLAGRGQIAFTDYFFVDGPPTPITAPITGGSGEFLGATGTVAISQLSGPVGDYLFTFTK
jgi:hypothetical protein